MHVINVIFLAKNQVTFISWCNSFANFTVRCCAMDTTILSKFISPAHCQICRMYCNLQTPNTADFLTRYSIGIRLNSSCYYSYLAKQVNSPFCKALVLTQLPSPRTANYAWSTKYSQQMHIVRACVSTCKAVLKLKDIHSYTGFTTLVCNNVTQKHSY